MIVTQGARAWTARPRSTRPGPCPITDMARTYDPDQPVVVINARTGQRQLIWAEIDANPANPRT